MSDIFEPINFYETNSKSNSIYDFNILEEMAKSEKRGTGSQFERLFNHMLKYQFQRNLQSPSWITTIENASEELIDCSKKASLWNSITEDDLKKYYNTARRLTISKSADSSTLERNIPTDRPYYYSKENSINSEFIKSFCRTYMNNNLPEIVKYVNNMK